MYYSSLRDIETTLASFNQLPIYPSDYQGDIDSQIEFCRYTVLPSTSQVYNNNRDKFTSGLLIIDIFVEAGKGQSKAFQISDNFDTLLQNKILANKTELGTSYLTYEGVDPVNKSLTRYKYTIPFKIYGE